MAAMKPLFSKIYKICPPDVKLRRFIMSDGFDEVIDTATADGEIRHRTTGFC